MAAMVKLEEAGEAPETWHARAPTPPPRPAPARREARLLARRWEQRLDDAARGALLVAPATALRALIEVRRARVARGLRRAATLGIGAMFAAGAVAALAV